jgi:hypothetical protein
VSLESDAANCGACGNLCPATGVCAAGSCAAVACSSGRFGLSGEEDLFGPQRTNFAFPVDVDGDGLLDIVTAEWDTSTVQVLRNLGGRRFAPPAVYATGLVAPRFGNPFGLAMGDVTGDGRPDAVAFVDGALSLLVALPGGTFSAGARQDVPIGIKAAAVGDLNGDGLADVVIANGIQIGVSLSRPTGGLEPVFFHAASNLLLQPKSVAVADLDGDGLPEVIAGEQQGGAIGVFKNLGGGALADPVPYLSSPADLVWAVAAGDLDGDGHPDVVAVVEGDHNGIAVFRNQGDGSLAAPVFVETGFFSLAIAIADVDGDGSLDVVLGNRGDQPRVDVLRNRGDGTFLPAESYLDRGPDGVAIADVDSDGRRDIVVASRSDSGIRVLWNEGGGQFQKPPLVAAPITPDQLVLADMDGDGRQDVVALDSAAGKLALFKGRGGGAFGLSQVTELAGAADFRVGDLDGDGLPDLVVLRVNVNSSPVDIVILRNGGGGTFSEIQTVPSGGLLALADLDGDGKLDLVSRPSLRPENLVYRPGLGDGTFGASVDVSPDGPDAVAFLDFDGDGMDDVVYSTIFDVRAVRNLGGGRFAAPVVLATISPAESLAAGDLDGDGRPDLAVGSALPDATGILLNNGDGTFGRLQTLPLFPRQVVVAAIPGLGHGVVLGLGGTEGLAVVEVARDGTLQPLRRWEIGAVPLSGFPLAAGDVDGDLRPDVVVGVSGGFTVLRSACLP